MSYRRHARQKTGSEANSKTKLHSQTVYDAVRWFTHPTPNLFPSAGTVPLPYTRPSPCRRVCVTTYVIIRDLLTMTIILQFRTSCYRHDTKCSWRASHGETQKDRPLWARAALRLRLS